MMFIYLGITVTAAVFLVTDMVLRYMEKVKNFGFNRKFFSFKGQLIPIEKFLPLDLTLLFVFLLALGGAGMALTFAELGWYLSLPMAIFSGMLVCFIIQHPIRAALDKKAGKTLPLRDKAAGAEGYAVGTIRGDDYGVVDFEYNNTRFRAPAVSAYETTIPHRERVIVLYEENGFYFVQSIREVYDVVEEE